MAEDVTKPSKDSESEIIRVALERFKLASEADSAWRELSLDDLKFSTGDQWPLNIKTQREAKNKPCLVMDQIQQSVRLTCNEYRQQRPAITVDPVGSDSDVDTAEVLQGSIRHIEVISDGEIAYDGAHEFVVRCGIGSFRLLNDYADDDTDQQEIFIKPIRNPFSVYWQPGVPHQEAKWAFIVEDVPKEAYKQDFDDDSHDFSALHSTGDNSADWLTKEYVRVAEYFTVQEEKGKGKRPEKSVKWRKITAFDVKDTKDLPGTSIPILTAYGDDLEVDGKRFIAGLVRNAKGPQRMYNFFCSRAAEMATKAVASPVMAVAGSIAGYERQWEKASTGEIEVLPYNAVDIGGKPAGPPTILQNEPPIQAMAQMILQAANDLRAATGLYDPSLGQRKGDESGKAIERLQSQGDVATFNYSDNMAREMRRCGRLLIEWIRAIYDEPRIQRIIKPDGSVKQVVIHNGPDQAGDAQKMMDEQNQKLTAAQAKQKIDKIYDIGVGQYDIVVDVGPSYKTKRQEAVATQLDFLKLLPPEIAKNFIDLVTGNMDWPQAKEFSERAKKMLPPGLADEDPADPQATIQTLKTQLEQMSQHLKIGQEVIEKQTEMINQKQIEQQGKMQIAQMQEHSALLKAQIDSDTKKAVAEITTKAQSMNERMQSLEDLMADFHRTAHEKAMQDDQHAHDKDQAASAAANAQQTQEADQGHDLVMAEQSQNGDGQ